MTTIERFADLLAAAHLSGQPVTLDAELDGLPVDSATRSSTSSAGWT